MFRTQFIYPDSDIVHLQSVKDCEMCCVELDSVGRPLGAQPVDQFDAQPFMMGENGFHRSDIAVLMSAQSDDLKRAVAQRLTEINTQFPDQTLSDAELAQMAFPRYAQGYADMRDWYSSLDKSGLAKQVDAYIKANTPKQPDSTIKFDDPSNVE